MRWKTLFRAAAVGMAAVGLLALAFPAKSRALVIGLEESPNPPKGVEIIPDDQLNQVKPVESPEPVEPPTPAAPAPAEKPAEEKEAKKYNGLFKAWQPLDSVFPLQAATFGVYGINFLKDEAFTTISSRYTGYTNYYLQGGKDFGAVKDFRGTFQYNKQTKNQLTTNSVIQMSGDVQGVKWLYDNNSKITNSGGGVRGGVGIETTRNKADTRKYSGSYAPNDRFSLAFNKDVNITRSFSASSTSMTSNSKSGWVMQTKPYKETALTASQIAINNIDYRGGASTKTRQTDISYMAPIGEKWTATLAYQFVGNQSFPGDPTQNTETKKSVKAASLGYKLKEDLQLAYTYSHMIDRSYSSGGDTSFGTTGRDLQLVYKPLDWLQFNGKNKVSFALNSGKTAQKQASFTLDHQGIRFLPGATTVQLDKNVKMSSDASGPKKSMTYNASTATPLKYFEGRLTITPKLTQNEQIELTALADTTARSLNTAMDGGLKVTNSLNLTGAYNETSTTNLTFDATTSEQWNQSISSQATFNVKMPLSKKFKTADNLKISFSRTQNQNKQLVPDWSLTETRVKKLTGELALKQEKKLNLIYAIERNISESAVAPRKRALTHKANWTLDDVLGFKFIGNYSVTLQTEGSVSGGVFKLMKENAGATTSLSYEFSKNQAPYDRFKNTMNRYFEVGVEFKLE